LSQQFKGEYYQDLHSLFKHISTVPFSFFFTCSLLILVDPLMSCRML